VREKKRVALEVPKKVVSVTATSDFTSRSYNISNKSTMEEEEEEEEAAAEEEEESGGGAGGGAGGGE